MRILLAFFLFLLLSISPAEAKERFLAVFCNPGWEGAWTKHDPDLVYTPTTWAEFDVFLDILDKSAAPDQEIDIDLAIHGKDYLYIQTKTSLSKASMGFVVNHIESKFKKGRVRCFCEACYSPYVYITTIRNNNLNVKSSVDKMENANHVPSFPIYGLENNTTGFVGLIYLQNKYKVFYSFQDLRLLELEPEIKLKKTKDNNLRLIYNTLYFFGA